MTIEMDENIRAIVFAPFADTSDFMVAISTHPDGVMCQGRIRHYGKDNGDPFLDDDRKEWFSGVKKGVSVEEELSIIQSVIDKLETVAALSGRRKRPQSTTVLKRGEGETLDSFSGRMLKQPWAHSKRVEGGKNDLQDR